MIGKEFFDGKTSNEQKAFLKEWFLNNYEDPVDCCPYEDGEYVYIWGWPYYPKEELEEHFSGYVAQVVIDEVAKELESISWEWSDLPENDDEELSYFLSKTDDPYCNFLSACNEITGLLDESINSKETLYKMLYAQTISAMEQFLSSYFIGHIKDDVNLCIKFINSCDDLKKIRLNEFAESKKTITEFCCKHALEKIVWHKFRVVKNYYKEVLGICFPEDISMIYQGIKKRHHIVHRNGKDYDNIDVIITKDDVNNLLVEITSFIEKIADIT